MKKLIILLILILLSASISFAGSIFKASTARKESSLCTDLSIRANQVGDIITVIVQPKVNINSTSSSSLSKSMSADLSFIPLNLVGSNKFVPLSLTGSHGSSSSETGKRQLDFQTTMSVTVQQILPNGNFLVMGNQHIAIGDKEQILHITGTIRPGDITPDNTISSTLIAELALDIDGDLGDIKDKRGILTKIMDLFF